MLVIEYDVTTEGMIELVALIEAIEVDDADPDGEAWISWRKSFEDEGLGCVVVTPEQLEAMAATEDPDELHAIVEALILADRRSKEQIPS